MIQSILTDIEGTTSSLSFVKDVLFPYARNKMPELIRSRCSDPALQNTLQEIRETAGADLDCEGILDTLLGWMDSDKKITPLKALQGILWEEGYRNKDFFGHIYADAKENLEKWKQEGLSLYVYSSGSIFAQKLLFGHTEFGDLNPLFSGYFDTTTGQKKDASSYRKISDSLQMPSREILFLSDIEKELSAAEDAGMNVCLLNRDAGMQKSAFKTVRNFNEISVSDFGYA